MFCELHTRSAFSFLSSGSQPQRLAARAAEVGISYMALMDRDTVAGAVRFHFEAKEQGVKPIIGAEITMEDGGLLPLIAMDRRGYQNLTRLITTIKLRSKKGEHSAKREDIEEHAGGLMCLTGGADGFIYNSVKKGQGLADLAWLEDTFKRRLYVELQRHHLRHQEDINQLLLGYAHKLRVPYFASNGVYYADQEDRKLFDVFTCIKNHCTIYDAGRLLSENNERYIKTRRQMLRLFEDIPEAVDITAEIASRVSFSMDELSYIFPDYPVGPGETQDEVLKAKAYKGAMERYLEAEKSVRLQIQNRLDKELAIIRMKKLAGYFLQVSDIADFCKRESILAQGRGSAANSVVCYSLGITAVDPIKHQLLFERFLSEKYEQYPDIDIDLPSGDDREKVIQEVYEKFGRRNAGMTANVICYRGKSAVREVGKTFGFGPDVLDRLSKLNTHYDTFRGEELNRRLKESGFNPDEDARLRAFAEMYARILDYPRHLGQHSGGMVIAWEKLDSITPLEPASMEGRTIIQWDKDDCEALKIVKVDLLGLGMMAVLRDSIELIKQHHGEDYSLYKVPHDDPDVYDALQRGDTIGMFQVESRAQIAFLPKSKPRTFYDIVVQVAIIRPGPVVGNMLNAYIKRRQGLEEVTYPHDSLRPVLERTLGVPLFQEQLLKIAMDIANFSGAEAEELRRAMGFKRPDRRMEKIEINLRAGMTHNGIPKGTQDTIVNCVKAFANYGFPESHAFSFALLAYASAFFIVHFRACFTAAMLNNYPLGFYSAATLVKDAQRHGLHFLPLDINRSQYEFTVEESDGEKKVRVGLKYVRGLRKEVAEKIIAVREKGSPPYEGGDRPPSGGQGWFSGRGLDEVDKGGLENHPVAEAATPLLRKEGSLFTSVAELIDRVPEINKREIRALSIAGALNFDGAVHRRQALWESELAIQPKGELFENAERGMMNDESEEESNSSFLQRMEGLQLVDADLRKTGISIGKHPMSFMREKLREKGVLSAEESRNLAAGDIASVAGAVIVRQRPMTAKNVVFITLEDETGHSNFVVMPDIFERYREVITQNSFLIIRGIFEDRGMIKALHFKPLTEITTEVVSHNFR